MPSANKTSAKKDFLAELLGNLIVFMIGLAIAHAYTSYQCEAKHREMAIEELH